MEKTSISGQKLFSSVIFTLALIICAQAQANDTSYPVFNPKLVLLSSIQNINLRDIDSVSDGCWRNPSNTLDAVELSFRRNKFGVNRGKREADGTTTFENSFLPTLEVGAVGYELSDTSCAVHITVELSSIVGINLPTPDGEERKTGLTYISLFQRSILMSGSKQDMQSRISEAAVECAESAMLEILRAQENLQKNYPDYWKFLGE